MTDRRGFFAFLGTAAAGLREAGVRGPGPGPHLEVTPTALFRQPDGRTNLVRVTVTGLDAPAGRARIADRRGVLLGTAGLLPDGDGAGAALTGEVWLPLSGATEFAVELEVGKRRVARRLVRVTPPRRWTLYWIASSHTELSLTDPPERCLEAHYQNLDAALARLASHPEFYWTPECAVQVVTYAEARAPAAGEALARAIRDGKIGFPALFASLLTGLLDHPTYAQAVWPAGLYARDHGLGYAAALTADVPGQVATFPTLLAASGVRYLASGVNPERAVPLLSRAAAVADGAGALGGAWTAYPQLYWWEGPDGSRVLHWRTDQYADGPRLGFDVSVAEMARRLTDWLLGHPVLRGPDYPYDVALLWGAAADNGVVDERVVANVEEFNRRYAFPRIVAARPEEFFRDVERRFGPTLPVRRGDTGCYREDGALSTARELARYRTAQLGARAAELLALWDQATEQPGAGAAARIAARAEERRRMWRDLLVFGEHTWGARASVSDPDAPETLDAWRVKRRSLERGAATAEAQVAAALLRIGLSAGAAAPDAGGAARVIFNASSWPRADVVRIAEGAGHRFGFAGRDWPAVDLPDGSALVVARDVPALGYLVLTEEDRPPRPPEDEGDALEARAGGYQVVLDPASGAIRSFTTGDGRERVRPGAWSGLNQLVYVQGGARSALWSTPEPGALGLSPELAVAGARLVAARRERLPGIGCRLVVERSLAGATAVTTIVTLYDELPWLDLENRITKAATLEKEALYVAFPFALTSPTVEVEVPLGRVTVEGDQQPGSCRDWYCHTHWVWLRDSGGAGGAGGGILWSGPDTPLFTLNDIFRGVWRRRLEPDGTLFAYVLHNYWYRTFAARQDGEFVCRYRLSALGPGDPVEPVRRGWAACEPLYVSAAHTSAAGGSLPRRGVALAIADRGVMVVGAKPADDGFGAIVKLADASGATRSVGVRPGAYAFTRARRANFVEMNGDAVPVATDGTAAVALPAWGTAALRLFTPRERLG
ncbi:MAG TPA: hypothetical protein VM736_07820 [Gemmatimonadales bacterium]|nr:hypothetical protein [Gemmatimonadales bacterium]